MKNDQRISWSSMIANAIERNLRMYLNDTHYDSDFVDGLTRLDERLCDSQNIKDPQLFAVWHFADTFFDAVSHGSPESDGIPIDEAIIILLKVIEQLRSDKEIDDPCVMSYAHQWYKR